MTEPSKKPTRRPSSAAKSAGRSSGKSGSTGAARKAARPSRSAFASGAARASGERRRRSGTPLIGMDAAVPAESAPVTVARRTRRAEDAAAAELTEAAESALSAARAAEVAAVSPVVEETTPKAPKKRASSSGKTSAPSAQKPKKRTKPKKPASADAPQEPKTADGAEPAEVVEKAAAPKAAARRPSRAQVSSGARRGGLRAVPSAPELDEPDAAPAADATGFDAETAADSSESTETRESSARPARRPRPSRAAVSRTARAARPAASDRDDSAGEGRSTATASTPSASSDSSDSSESSDTESNWSLARASKFVGQVLDAAEVSSTMRPSAGDVVEMVITLLRSAATAAGLDAEAAEEQIAQVLAYLRRRLTGDYEVDEFGFDEDFTDHVQLPLLRPLYRKWFRVEVKGIENIPAEGGALIVANHSGTVAIDSLMTQVAVHDETPGKRNLRMLGADLVFQTPFIGTIARRSGSTLAATADAERLLAKGELVGVWPEGFKGVGKPFSERYKLQRFGRGGFVSAALRSQVPIIPCSIVGAEEIYPIIGNMPTVARLLGLPYAPITPTFPLLGPLGLIPLPSKWLIEFGPPIATDSFEPEAADDPMLVFDLTDQVRETIQQTLYSLLMQRKSVFI